MLDLSLVRLFDWVELKTPPPLMLDDAFEVLDDGLLCLAELVALLELANLEDDFSEEADALLVPMELARLALEEALEETDEMLACVELA